MNRSYLPSKKFLIFLICVILIAVFFIFRKKIFKDEPTYTKEQKEFLNTKIEDFATTDTDGDGLFDWEEALWATDPEKIDSDGDGVTDKEYVSQKRSELGITPTESNPSTTETERISMEFFTILSSLEQKGLLNSQTMQNIAEVFGGEIAEPYIIDESSIETDFNIVNPTRENSILYKEKMMAVLSKAQEGLVGREMEFFSKYISEPLSKNKTAVGDISKAYSGMSSSLSKISVPSDIQEIHKEMIINSAKLGIAVNLLLQYEDDPVLTTKGFSIYKEVSPLLEENIYSLSSYFQKINN